MNKKVKLLLGLLLVSLVSLAYLVIRLKPSKRSTNLAPTPPPETDNYHPEGAAQGEADYKFSKTVESEVSDLPFITSLPIVTDKYTIIFDFEKNTIRVRLGTNVPQNQIEEEVLKRLREIKVDTKKFPVYYLP